MEALKTLVRDLDIELAPVAVSGAKEWGGGWKLLRVTAGKEIPPQEEWQFSTFRKEIL
jgi:hypothetical protein